MLKSVNKSNLVNMITLDTLQEELHQLRLVVYELTKRVQALEGKLNDASYGPTPREILDRLRD